MAVTQVHDLVEVDGGQGGENDEADDDLPHESVSKGFLNNPQRAAAAAASAIRLWNVRDGASAAP